MKLVSPGVLVPLKFEPQVMGHIVGPLKTDKVISMVLSLQFDPISLSTVEGKRKFSLI